ncbi:hypothetical protein VNI00_015271 [Paramarasmius palmivorus]|uniref:Uncharacterized protein n=1 Tax=Paramarasmius palmivorus TaxID=297713 RepID=A0AAW0BKA4_9AGAR
MVSLVLQCSSVQVTPHAEELFAGTIAHLIPGEPTIASSLAMSSSSSAIPPPTNVGPNQLELHHPWTAVALHQEREEPAPFSVQKDIPKDLLPPPPEKCPKVLTKPFKKVKLTSTYPWLLLPPASLVWYWISSCF